MKIYYREDGTVEGIEYELSEITPIQAICPKCGFLWTGRNAIIAPDIKQCRCFWCDSKLKAIENTRPKEPVQLEML